MYLIDILLNNQTAQEEQQTEQHLQNLLKNCENTYIMTYTNLTEKVQNKLTSLELERETIKKNKNDNWKDLNIDIHTKFATSKTLKREIRTLTVQINLLKELLN